MILRIVLAIAFLYNYGRIDAQPMHSASKMYAFRLKPHQDLKKSVLQFARDHSIKAGAIVTCVGSLEQFHLRFANQKSGTKKSGHFEIVSCTGTFSDDGTAHLHVLVSDSTGNTIGGHLMDENLIYTTAEIVIAELSDLQFERMQDPTYGYPELLVSPRKQNEP